MTIALLGDRILARLIEETESAGGIALPSVAQMTQPVRRAVIVNAGPGTKKYPMELKIGDTVAMDFGGGWVTLEGERLISATQGNVLAVLE